MPFINIKVLKGTLSDQKKAEIISRVSEVVAEVECRPHPKEALLPHTWCVIEEVEMSSWGIGGTPLSPEILQAVLEGKA